MLRVYVAVLIGLCLVQGAATTQAQDTVRYYHTDAIGSVRAITDETGQTIARYDFLPFGEEFPLTPDDHVPLQFGGKERDYDTGFDYSGARYFASGNGRFTTVDPVLDVDQALVDPQRWNRYIYVRNNPFRFVDPDGRAIETLWDVASLGMSLHAVWQNPTSVWNWVSVGADVVSVAGPGIPAIGMVIRSGNNVDRAIDITQRAAALDDLSRAAAQADRNGLTKAGRALQKHGSDPAGSVFPRVAGHKALNEMGQTIVDDILTAPGAETSIVMTRRYGTVIEVRAPDGRGLRYDEYGNLMGFLEP